MTGVFLAHPERLWALAALAAVVIIYLFRRRHRPLAVTGLFLWGIPGRETPGGGTLKPPPPGRSLILDLLAAAFLALALAGPVFRNDAGMRRAVILDGSFAMRARDCHLEARRLVDRLLEGTGDGQAALVLAGARPAVLAGFGADRAALAAAGAGYLPSSEKGELQAAVNLVRDLYGPGVEYAVVTNRDGQLPAAAAGDRLSAHVLAGRGGNLALSRLWRERDRTGEGREILTLAVDNHSENAAETRLNIGLDRQGERAGVYEEKLPIPAGKTAFAEIRLAEVERETLIVGLEAIVGGDVIADDSLAFAPPTPARAVSYGIKGLNDAVARYFRLGLEAAGCLPSPSADGGDAPDLLVTNDATARGRVLTVLLSEPAEPGVYNPPYLVDLASPLCRDVELSEVPWVVANAEVPAQPGRIFIMAGSQPLYWEDAPGLLRLNLLPERCRIVREPAWPALLANVAAEASARLPGLVRALYRPGEILRYRPDPEAEAKPLFLYSGERELAVSPSGREFALPANAGLYSLRNRDGEVGSVSVLPMYGNASDATALSVVSKTLEAGSERLAGETGGMDLTWAALGLGLLALGMNWRYGRRAPK